MAKQLKDEIDKREDAERKAIAAEQATNHLQQMVNMLTSQLEKMELQIVDLEEGAKP